MEKQDLKDILTQKAIERVESTREEIKPDFDDLGEAVGRRMRAVRGGVSKIITKGVTAAQKLKNIGMSKIKKKLATRKGLKSKKRSGADKGSKGHRTQMKRKKSLRKGGHR